MKEAKCVTCGTRVWVLNLPPGGVFCPDCEEASRSAGTALEGDDAALWGLRPSSAKPAKKKKKTRRGPQPDDDPERRRLTTWAAVAVIGFVGIGLAAWTLGRKTDKPPPRQGLVDWGFKAVPWKVPFGGAPEDPPLPSGTLPKQFFTPPRYPVTIGPGWQYLVYEPEISLRQGRFDRDSASLIEAERDLGKDVRIAYDFKRYYCAAAATPDGRVAVQNRREVLLWGADGEAAQLAVPLRVPLQGMPDQEEGRDLRRTWVGWAEDRVLFLDGGQLIAFDPAVNDRLFAVGQNYQRPVVVAPNGKWVILSAGRKHLEAIDTKTGDLLGRFGGRGDWEQLALSPDGKRLAMLCVKGRTTTDFTTWVVDLQSGAVDRVQYGYAVDGIAWLAPDRLMMITTQGGLVHDFTEGRVLYDVRGGEWPNGYKSRTLDIPGIWRNDGRLVLLTEREADGAFEFRLAIPEYPALDVIFGPGSDQPIEVEVDATHEGLRQIVREAVTDSLRERRYRLGSGGWKVAISGVIASVGSVQRKFRWGGVTNHHLPAFNGELRLIDPAGKLVQKRHVGGAFPFEPREDFYEDLNAAGRRPPRSGFGYDDYMIEIVAELTAASVAAESWPPTVVRTKEGPRALPVIAPSRYEPVPPRQAGPVAGVPQGIKPPMGGPPGGGRALPPGRLPPGAFAPARVAVNPLQQALDDAKQGGDKRLSAVQALATLTPAPRHRAEVVAALAPLLDDPEAGAGAAYALDRWAAPADVPALVAGLGARDARVRASLIRTIARFQAEEAIPALVKHMAVPEDRAEASRALQALGAKAAPALRELLKTDDPDTRREAMKLVREFPDNDSDTRLTLALADLRSPDQAERERALRELGTLHAVDDSRGEVLDAVLPLMKHPDLMTRRYALSVVVRWGTAEQVPALVDVLDDADRNSQWVAVGALGKLTDPRAALALARRLESPQLSVLATAALKEMKPRARELEPGVLQALESPDWETRKAACKALRVLGTAASVPALKKAAADGNRSVAAAASDALYAIDPSAVLATPAAKSKAKANARRRR